MRNPVPEWFCNSGPAAVLIEGFVGKNHRGHKIEGVGAILPASRGQTGKGRLHQCTGARPLLAKASNGAFGDRHREPSPCESFCPRPNAPIWLYRKSSKRPSLLPWGILKETKNAATRRSLGRWVSNGHIPSSLILQSEKN